MSGHPQCPSLLSVVMPVFPIWFNVVLPVLLRFVLPVLLSVVLPVWLSVVLPILLSIIVLPMWFNVVLPVLYSFVLPVLFNVLRFTNDVCDAGDGEEGVCYTGEECTRKVRGGKLLSD